MIKFLKKPIGIISTILILGLAVGGYFYFGGEEKPTAFMANPFITTFYRRVVPATTARVLIGPAHPSVVRSRMTKKSVIATTGRCGGSGRITLLMRRTGVGL